MFMRAFLISLFSLLSTGALYAQDVSNGQVFGLWRVSCEALGKNRTTCVLIQTLNRDTDNAFIAQMVGFWAPDGSKAYIAARVPEGAYLPTGFILQGETTNKPVPFVWQSCVQGICEALREINEEMIEDLTELNETVLGQFQPRLGMKPFAFRFSMTGVVEGLDALRPETP